MGKDNINVGGKLWDFVGANGGKLKGFEGDTTKFLLIGGLLDGDHFSHPACVEPPEYYEVKNITEGVRVIYRRRTVVTGEAFPFFVYVDESMSEDEFSKEVYKLFSLTSLTP